MGSRAKLGRIKLDHQGLGRILRSAEVGAAVRGPAMDVADHARSDPNMVRNGLSDDVEVKGYNIDRAAYSVMIAHPAGAPIQAKHGVLTRAAAAAGLKVRSRNRAK